MMLLGISCDAMIRIRHDRQVVG